MGFPKKETLVLPSNAQFQDSPRTSLAIFNSVFLLCFCFIASAPAFGQTPTACHSPLWPMCATQSFSLEEVVGKQRCIQDIERYVSEMADYLSCLEDNESYAKRRLDSAEQSLECLTSEDPATCRDQLPDDRVQ